MTIVGTSESIFKQRARIGNLAACFARALLHPCPSPEEEDAGKTGRRLAPMDPVLNVLRTNAQGDHRAAEDNPAFPAQWLMAYAALSPEPNSFGLRRLAN